MKKTEQKNVMDYLADILAWVLGGAMFLYLGFRTLNFLSFTLSDQDQIYKWLGWFSTTLGAVIFAIIYKRSFYFDRRARLWRSDEFRKTVSGVMAIVCALGEFALAAADMSLQAALKTGIVTMSEGELNTIIYGTAGLAFLVGLSVAMIKMTPRHPQTDPVIDMSEYDFDNNGVMDKQEQRNQQQRAMNVNASETEQVKQNGKEGVRENHPQKGQ
jgi:hypothetical protein